MALVAILSLSFFVWLFFIIYFKAQLQYTIIIKYVLFNQSFQTNDCEQAGMENLKYDNIANVAFEVWFVRIKVCDMYICIYSMYM